MKRATAYAKYPDDPQCGRLCAAEDELPTRKFRTIDDVCEFIEPILWTPWWQEPLARFYSWDKPEDAPLLLVTTKGVPKGCHAETVNEDHYLELKIRRDALNLNIVLHELAHFTVLTAPQSHGPEFAYKRLQAERLFGVDYKQLRREFRAYGVKTRRVR